MVTAKESIAVPVDKVSYRTGTKLEAGVSAQVSRYGSTGGFVWFMKQSFRFIPFENKPEVKDYP